jgi:large subunit ribosomal protein L21
MAYAVFETGGKQYRVQPGDQIEIDRVALEVGDEARFERVLLIGEGDTLQVGTPTVAGASVSVKVLGQVRGPKGVAFKFKRRTGHHKTKGFRRHLTKLEITGINA